MISLRQLKQRRRTDVLVLPRRQAAWKESEFGPDGGAASVAVYCLSTPCPDNFDTLTIADLASVPASAEVNDELVPGLRQFWGSRGRWFESSRPEWD